MTDRADQERRRILERLETLEQRSAELQRDLRRLRDLMAYEGGSAEPGTRPHERPAPAEPAARAGPTVGPPPSARTRVESQPSGRPWARVDVEFWLGGRGLLLLGVLALVLAVGFFLKYSIERGWIGPLVRVLMGAGVGVAAAALGERIRAAGHRTYGLWLSAGGFGAVYLSVWAAAELYALVPAGVGFALMVAVVGAAAGLGVLRDSEAFVTLAAFGGYLAPILVGVEPTSSLFGVGYLAILSGAGLGQAGRAGWPYLAALSALGGSFMTLPADGAPHLHGVYLVVLVAGAMWVARRRHWAPVSALVALAGWITLVAGSGDWGIRGLGYAVYGALIWLADLVAVVGVGDWVAPGTRRKLESREPDADRARAGRYAGIADACGALTTLVPPWFFFFVALAGVGAHYPRWRDTVGVVLGLAIGTVYLGLAARGAEGRGSAARIWRAGLGYAFWLVAPTIEWSGGALIRAWLLEGFALTAWGAWRAAPEARAAGLAAFGLALWGYSAEAALADGEGRAFIGLRALTGLGVPLGLAGWGLAVDRAERPVRWEAALRPIVLLFAALVFLDWGTREIHRFYEALPGGGVQWALARDLSISGFWMAYAAALLGTGLALARPPLRWAGLAMALIAAGKVFFYDLANLAQLYRIVSFVLLAIVLLGLSYGYQRLRRGDEDEVADR